MKRSRSIAVDITVQKRLESNGEKCAFIRRDFAYTCIVTRAILTFSRSVYAHADNERHRVYITFATFALL